MPSIKKNVDLCLKNLTVKKKNIKNITKKVDQGNSL